MDEGQKKQLNELALEVLDNARSRLLVNLRFMDTALTFHKRKAYEGSVSTDGRSLYYDPLFVLRSYRDASENITRIYLHSVLHCVFMHPFVGNITDPELWDLACDIAAEAVIDELGLAAARTEKEEEQEKQLRKIRRRVRYLTAERIYRWLASDEVMESDVKKLESIFRTDDHSVWYTSTAGDEEGGAKHTQMMQSEPVRNEDAEFWKETAEKIEMELETFAKVRGSHAGSLMQNLRAVTREKHDYAEFLRKFASMNEELKVSDEDFDYIYYTYGLEHYRNIPLIEPLEYKEDNRIRDFVIAIDTSGSVAGEEVQSFLQKTCDILRSRQSFRGSVNVHMIQCDAEVQSDFVIKDAADLDRYIETMDIKGLGGTDFRPVFSYVDELIRQGAFTDLKGLLYFTDGLGTFPDRCPEYRTAFVFVDDGYSKPKVPAWAMKVIL